MKLTYDARVTRVAPGLNMTAYYDLAPAYALYSVIAEGFHDAEFRFPLSPDEAAHALDKVITVEIEIPE